MEFKVIEESKAKLVFELKSETHTFCNLLKDELLNTKGVVTATYRVDHPLTGVPRFLLETKGVEPRKALKDALNSIKKKAEAFRKEVAEF